MGHPLSWWFRKSKDGNHFADDLQRTVGQTETASIEAVFVSWHPVKLTCIIGPRKARINDLWAVGDSEP